MENAMLGYTQMWDSAKLNEAMLNRAKLRMVNAINNQSEYKTVMVATGVPITFLAPIHEREASMSFVTHLHNGDPLNARTVHVPAGRPPTGNPPFRWSYSAIDALKYEKIDQVKNWSAERILYEQHKYNGITKYPSSYVFSGTQYYTSGMWVRDHIYDPSTVDSRPGTLIMVKALLMLQPGLVTTISREPFPPKDVIDEHKSTRTKTSRTVRNASGGAGAATAGTEVATKPKTAIAGVPITTIGIGFCAAVFIVAAIWVLVKKTKASEEIHALWSGT